ncbi:MAG TPA: hypothetical protein VGN52_20000 [Burkholderiales bacterium]|jgi:hypothetical protein
MTSSSPSFLAGRPRAAVIARAGLLLLTLLCAACAAPSVHDAKLLVQGAPRLTRVQLAYRWVPLKEGEHTRFGNRQVPLALTPEIGVEHFGDPLARQAQAAFAAHGVAVTATQSVEPGARPRLIASADGGPQAPLLLITPAHGRIVNSRFSTSVVYVFNVVLVDPNTRRALWRASIDTSAVSSDPSQPMYDDTHARQVLDALAEQMQHDGLL